MKYELIKKQTRRIKKNGKKILHWFEIVLGILSVLAVIVFGAWQVLNFMDLNWGDIQTYTYSLKIILEEMSSEHQDVHSILELISNLRVSFDQFVTLNSPGQKPADDNFIKNSFIPSNNEVIEQEHLSQ